MVGREEREREIHRVLADLPADDVRDITSRRFRVGTSRERRRKLERAVVCGLGRMGDHLIGVAERSDAGVHAFRSVLGELLVVSPHVGIVVVELCQKIVQFGRVLGFERTDHPRLQEFTEGISFFHSGQEPEPAADLVFVHDIPRPTSGAG